MAKDRRKRYPHPDELILDLESLLVGESPKMARQRIESAMLQDLAEGEADEEEEEDDTPEGPPGGAWLWIGILGGALVLSLIVNLILLIKK